MQHLCSRVKGCEEKRSGVCVQGQTQKLTVCLITKENGRKQISLIRVFQKLNCIVCRRLSVNLVNNVVPVVQDLQQ